MKNLNAEQIKKALECCKTTTPEDCIECPYRKKGNSLYVGCVNTLVKDALALITSQEQRIKELSEDLHASCTELTQNLHECKADTVRKMQEILCEGRVSNDPVVIAVNVAAKEMLEHGNE